MLCNLFGEKSGGTTVFTWSREIFLFEEKGLRSRDMGTGPCELSDTRVGYPYMGTSARKQRQRMIYASM